MDIEEKIHLITRNLQEVIGEEKLRSVLKERDLKVYWGTATTGKPHVAYFVPMSKIADFLKAECEVTILLADVHACLDNMKATWELVCFRTDYYETVIKSMLKSIGVPLDKLRFIRGTEYQLNRQYTVDMYRLSSIATEHDAKKAGAEVVKQVDNPLLSGLLYPGLQALDEEHLKVDAQFGGVDQRKIFVYAEKYLPMPEMGYAKRVHLMNPMVPGLTGGKMSASEEDSKIDLLDSREGVAKKLARASCEVGNTDNGVLAFIRYVLFPLNENTGFVVEKGTDGKETVTFENYSRLEEAYLKQAIDPDSLKRSVERYLNKLLDPIRKDFETEANKKLTSDAYPPKSAIKEDDESKWESVSNSLSTLSSEAESKYNLITRNLKEIVGESKLRSILNERDLRVFWGIATASKLDVSYFAQMKKISDFLKAGCHVTVLLADLHSFLDNKKTPWDLLAARSAYFEKAIRHLLISIGAPDEKVTFVRGTDYQLSKEYMLDVYRLSTVVTMCDAEHAGQDTVKQVDHPLLGSRLYPLLQALDEQHLKVDAQFGGEDQAKILKFSKKYLPKLGFEPKIHLINSTAPKLPGGKVGLTEDESKIDVLETKKNLKKKLGKTFCEPGNIANNPVLAYVKDVIIPLNDGKGFLLKRPKEFGGDASFSDFASLEAAFEKQEIHPGDLKNAVEGYLNDLLEPIRTAFQNSANAALITSAYPPPKKEAVVKSGGGGGGGGGGKTEDKASPSALDIRVGRITGVKKHPDSDTLYILSVDLGEAESRTVVSGLAKIIAADELNDRLGVFLCNLRPATLLGIESKAMLLCASRDEPKALEVLSPPETCKPGDVVYAEDSNAESTDQKTELKKKIWEKLQVDLKVDGDMKFVWKESRLVTRLGDVTSKSLRGVRVK